MNELPLDDVVYYAGGAPRGGTLVEDAEVEGIPCRGGQVVEWHENGRLDCVWLAKDAVVAGVPCAADSHVEFHPSGALRWVRLAGPHRVGEVPCAAGSAVYFHSTGALSNAALGEGWGGYRAGSRVTLDADGNVLEWSSDVPPDGVVDGLPCREDHGVWRYPSGRLSNVRLAGPAAIHGATYEADTELELDERGRVVGAEVLNLEDGVRYRRRNYGRYEPA